MKIENQLPISFDWKDIPSDRVNGLNGYSIIKSKLFSGIQVRQVQYSSNYEADHWCEKGHLVYVLEEELILEYQDASTETVTKGMVYFVGDGSMPHKAISKTGALVLIVD